MIGWLFCFCFTLGARGYFFHLIERNQAASHEAPSRDISVLQWASVASWVFLLPTLTIGSLISNNYGYGNENVASKYNFMVLHVFCDYSISFKLYNMGKVSYNWIGTNDLEEKMKNERLTVACSLVMKTLNLASSCRYCADYVKEMY